MKLKGLTIALIVLCGSYSANCQEDLISRGRKAIDSILSVMDKEPDAGKRFNELLAVYNTTTDGFPVLMFELYQKMLLLAKEKNDLVLESNAWSFAGQGYRLTGNYIKALECHHKAIALAELTGNPSVLGYAQNQMAHIYKDREENDIAINLYRSAAANIEKGDNEFLKMSPLMNLGAVMIKANKLDSSLYFSEKAYAICVKQNVTGYLNYVAANMATVYSKKNEMAAASKYFKQAMEFAEINMSPRFLNNTYIGVAEHFYRHHQIDSSILYAKKAIYAVENTGLSNLALVPAKLLTDIYESRNADSTLKYLRVFRAANDSLFSARANQQVQMMTFEEEQRQRNIREEKINYQNKIKTNVMLAGLAVFLLIALILYRNFKQKLKANKVLQKTLTDLNSTQAQLIQSEKMASLGELTAGIAHEIQNPLNFVNNFSEVNNELITELIEEVDKGNFSEVKLIAADIQGNSEKITHHGKRADAIVKGMLQHSRSGSGQKEPTDLNALCDEYLRLSYHGLRAKDKSFNAGFETQFDDTIGKINVLPQEIGRVILNLINNAFYAVEQKSKQNIPDYKPTVKVSTKKMGDKVQIIVADNGNGIPQGLLDKIFQPFFTTKPTGEGTGLGLSLSYDIIRKGHGGDLKVETRPGEGATFFIYLPLNQTTA